MRRKLPRGLSSASAWKPVPVPRGWPFRAPPTRGELLHLSTPCC